jgi:hypothetical protein
LADKTLQLEFSSKELDKFWLAQETNIQCWSQKLWKY